MIVTKYISYAQGESSAIRERNGDALAARGESAKAGREYAKAQELLPLDWPGHKDGISDWRRLQSKLIAALDAADNPAAAMGRKGGAAKTPAKVAAARRNVAKAQAALTPAARKKRAAAAGQASAKALTSEQRKARAKAAAAARWKKQPPRPGE